jgi:5-(aminomethyl)-3-furanmethanol phosphate kinase
MTHPSEGLTIIKIGGGITWVPGALDRVCQTVGKLSREWPLVIIPGGGPFADGVREFDRRMGLSPDVAHWMAILAMDQYAHVLASRIPDAVLVEEPGWIRAALAGVGPVVLAPYRWMRSADVLPHSWEVSSDSIAAFVAGALDARRLILIKPGSAATDPVDSYFFTALPAGMPYSIVGADRIEEVAAELSC